MSKRNAPIHTNPSPPPVTQPRRPLGQERKGNMAIPGNNNGRAGPEGQRERTGLRSWLNKNRGLEWS